MTLAVLQDVFKIFCLQSKIIGYNNYHRISKILQTDNHSSIIFLTVKIKY